MFLCCREELMFWSDVQNSQIAMATLDKSNVQVLVNMNIEHPGESYLNC